MQPVKFLHILAIAAVLSLYSAWSLASKNTTAPSESGESIVLPHRIPLIRMAEAHRLWQDNGTLFVDVRPAFDYEVGHIAGAIHLPEDEFEKHLPALRDRLARARAIVVYCKSTDCGQSLWAAIRLHNEGLAQARIYPRGWNEWVNSGLPVARGAKEGE